MGDLWGPEARQRARAESTLMRSPMLRCEHGMLAGICVVAACRHWDGRPTYEEPDGTGQKTCRLCHVEKLERDFYLSSNGTRRSECKVCMRARSARRARR